MSSLKRQFEIKWFRLIGGIEDPINGFYAIFDAFGFQFGRNLASGSNFVATNNLPFLLLELLLLLE